MGVELISSPKIWLTPKVKEFGYTGIYGFLHPTWGTNKIIDAVIKTVHTFAPWVQYSEPNVSAKIIHWTEIRCGMRDSPSPGSIFTLLKWIRRILFVSSTWKKNYVIQPRMSYLEISRTPCSSELCVLYPHVKDHVKLVGTTWHQRWPSPIFRYFRRGGGQKTLACLGRKYQPGWMFPWCHWVDPLYI